MKLMSLLSVIAILIILIITKTSRDWGASDVFTIFFPPSVSVLSRPVHGNCAEGLNPSHSLMLSCHLFLCLPFLRSPGTGPCKMVSARLQRWSNVGPYHLRFFFRGSAC